MFCFWSSLLLIVISRSSINQIQNFPIFHVGIENKDIDGKSLWFRKPRDDALRIVVNNNRKHICVRFDEASNAVRLVDRPINEFLEIPTEMALKQTNHFRSGDIVKLINLRQQRNATLNQIVRLMNNSYGIIMSNSLRKRQNKTEIRVQWIVNPATKVGIRTKYVQRPFPNIYIHNLTGVTSSAAMKVLNTVRLDPNKDYICNIGKLNITVVRGVRGVRGEVQLIVQCMNHWWRFDIDSSTTFSVDKLIESLIVFSLKCTGLSFQTTITCLASDVAPHLNRKLLPKLVQMRDDIVTEYTKFVILTSNEYYNMTNFDSLEKKFILISKRIIREKIGIFLDAKYRTSFWKSLRNTILQVCYDHISAVLHEAPLKHGSAMTLDIVNLYLTASMPSIREFHVLIKDEMEFLDFDYDVIIEQIGAHLDVQTGYKSLLAKAIIKLVQY